ncbi:hypothetical protein V1509DRAFT_370084 [Lipomyces kononenkoae]
MFGNIIIIFMATIAVAGMESYGIITHNLASIGYSVLTSLVTQYAVQSFSNQSPRSQCHNYDGKQMCVSWAVYSPHGMHSAERTDVSDFAAKCALEGKSAEMRVNLISGTTETVCV